MPFSPQTIEIRLNNLKGQNTMNKAQHTPGQWSAQKIAMSGNYLINVREDDGNTFTIAQFTKSINMCGKRKAQHEANARLIAAAPELLEALKALWFKVESICELQDTGLQIECLKARAVIAKAEGK